MSKVTSDRSEVNVRPHRNKGERVDREHLTGEQADQPLQTDRQETEESIGQGRSLALRPCDLIGAWQLDRCVVRFADGRPDVYPFGDRATGQLIYSAAGKMSATLSEASRSAHGVARLETARRATPEERVAAYDSYMAYDGSWHLDSWTTPPGQDEWQDDLSKDHFNPEGAWERRGCVTHDVERALTPNAVGEHNRRWARLKGRHLMLSYSLTPRSGVRRDYELIWKRSEPVLEQSLSLPLVGESMGRSWLRDHQHILARALQVTRTREAWSPYIESPRRALHPEGAKERGLAAYQHRLEQPFHFTHPMAGDHTQEQVGAECSPYTGKPLGVRYPRLNVDQLFRYLMGSDEWVEEVDRGSIDQSNKDEGAWQHWRWSEREERVGVCLEILSRWANASFEIAFATMHTAGQGYMLAFAGSGASSLDRGLEALAAAWLALDMIPENTIYRRSFGQNTPAQLTKQYLCSPVGPAVVFSCGSYPAWNAYPAMMANLAVGNPVIVKPHPDTILPVAIAVDLARCAIADAGFDPNILTLAADGWDRPIGLELVDHPATAIVDFTGGQRFGAVLERRDPRLQVYTETAGCNAVLLHSTDDLDETLDALAQGLCLFSAQMCTAPQNLWVSAEGMHVYHQVDGQRVLKQILLPDELGMLLARRVDELLSDPARAAGICGALHAQQTLTEMEVLRQEVEAVGGRILREATSYVHPQYPEARTQTPLICTLKEDARGPAQAERFGPMSFLITSQNAERMLHLAAQDTKRFGAIASYAYSVDDRWIAQAERVFMQAGASIGINLHRQKPMNFTAAFSDFHVTGLNPAGTASLTDPGFVSRRFRVVQSKREYPSN